MIGNPCNRREFLQRAGLGLAAAALAPALAARAAAGRTRPNVLLILTDQQHAGMLSCAGNPWLKTPAMDGLAAAGTRFERAYCGNPVCMPSRFAMFTGMPPSVNGIDMNGPAAPVPEPIMRRALGRVFRAAGYQTVYGGKTHFFKIAGGGQSVADYGFDRDLTRDEREELQAQCVSFLKEQGKNPAQPFLLVASFINPHDICYLAINAEARATKQEPAITPEQVAARKKTRAGKGGKSAKAAKAGGKGGKAASAAGGGVMAAMLAEALQMPSGVSESEFFAKYCPPLPANYAIPQGEPKGVETIDWRPFRGWVRKNWTDTDWRRHRWAYARLTERVDRQIGAVLEALRAAGLEDNTVVVLTSDHGDMDAAHHLEHKSQLYEEAIHVPFIVSWKGVTPPGAVDREHLVSTGLDLIPTLCDCAGIPVPAGLPGASVRLLAEGRVPADWRTALVVENEASRGILWGQYKYMVYAKGGEGTAREQLVDLAGDPGEMKNLAADPAHRARLLEGRRLLQDWYAGYNLKLEPVYVISERSFA